jgi:hypothetical protein
MQLVLARPPPRSEYHAEQTSVETHSALPDLEYLQGLVKIGRQVIEQDVAQPPAQHHAERAIENQVAVGLLVNAGQASRTHAALPQPPGGREGQQVHDSVPVDLRMHAPEQGQVPGAEVEGDRIDLVQDSHAGRALREGMRLLCRRAGLAPPIRCEKNGAGPPYSKCGSSGSSFSST